MEPSIWSPGISLPAHEFGSDVQSSNLKTSNLKSSRASDYAREISGPEPAGTVLDHPEDSQAQGAMGTEALP